LSLAPANNLCIATKSRFLRFADAVAERHVAVFAEVETFVKFTAFQEIFIYVAAAWGEDMSIEI